MKSLEIKKLVIPESIRSLVEKLAPHLLENNVPESDLKIIGQSTVIEAEDTDYTELN